jgi:hypothetical protein
MEFKDTFPEEVAYFGCCFSSTDDVIKDIITDSFEVRDLYDADLADQILVFVEAWFS